MQRDRWTNQERSSDRENSERQDQRDKNIKKQAEGQMQGMGEDRVRVGREGRNKGREAGWGDEKEEEKSKED